MVWEQKTSWWHDDEDRNNQREQRQKQEQEHKLQEQHEIRTVQAAQDMKVRQTWWDNSTWRHRGRLSSEGQSCFILKEQGNTITHRCVAQKLSCCPLLHTVDGCLSGVRPDTGLVPNNTGQSMSHLDSVQNLHVLHHVISNVLSSSYAEVRLWLFFLVFRPQCVW